MVVGPYHNVATSKDEFVSTLDQLTLIYGIPELNPISTFGAYAQNAGDKVSMNTFLPSEDCSV